MTDVLLLAVDWTQFVMPAIFLIVIVARLLALVKPTAPPARGNPPRRPPQGERTMRPPAAATGKSAQLNQEIEQFLKRANDRRGPAPRETSLKQAPKAARPKPSLAPPPSAEPVRVEPLERRGFDSVTASVQKHLGGSSFEQRAEHLGDDITRADQQMEQHLQQAFNRRVGTLDSGAAAASGAPVTDVQTEAADAVTAPRVAADLMGSAKNLRQAFMLSEILRRPEERW